MSDRLWRSLFDSDSQQRHDIEDQREGLEAMKEGRARCGRRPARRAVGRCRSRRPTSRIAAWSATAASRADPRIADPFQAASDGLTPGGARRRCGRRQTCVEERSMCCRVPFDGAWIPRRMRRIRRDATTPGPRQRRRQGNPSAICRGKGIQARSSWSPFAVPKPIDLPRAVHRPIDAM